MSENLERDKRSRAAHRTHVRRLISEANELRLIFDRTRSEHRQKAKHYMTTLKKKTDVIGELDKSILSAIKDDDIENEIEETSAFLDAINLCLVGLEELDIDIEQPPSPTNNDLQNTSMSSTNSTSTRVRARLPKLQLLEFDGKSTEWAPFWDNFESVIHSNEDLNEIDKFSYLKAQLQGSGSSTVSGLSLTGANYPIAVKLLKERYGDPQKIISGHMDALVNLPSVANGNLKATRQLSDAVESHTRALEALGCKPEQYGELFMPLLLNKIPKEIRLDICSKVKGESWNFRSVLTQLKEELTNRERCEFVAGVSAKPSRDDTKGEHSRRGFYRGPTTTSALVLGGEHKPEQKQEHNYTPTCVFCAQPHSSIHCQVVTNTQKRKEILMKTGRCFICTKKNHISRNCQSRTRCHKCQGRHHTSICQPREKSKNPDSQRDSEKPKNSEPPVEDEVSTTEGSNTSAHTVICHNTKATVLLQTAKATIYRSDIPHRKRNVRIILDGGSQRSYITERVKREMNLVTSHSESLTIKPFGTSSGTPKVWEVVDFCMNVDGDTDVQVSAISVPLISSPVQGQYLNQAVEYYPHLRNLQLADDCEGDAQVEILIGADHYWDLVTGGVIREMSGPTALHTKLGWVLSGPASTTTSQHPSTNVNITHVLKCDVSSHPSDMALNSSLQKFWELESLGIGPNENSVYDVFEQRITYNGKMYEVSLPWRESHPILHDNYDSSKKRLTSLLTRLKKHPGILEEYAKDRDWTSRRGPLPTTSSCDTT